MRPILLSLFLLVSSVSAIPAQDKLPLSVIDPLARHGVLNAAHASVESQLGKPVQFVVKQLRESGDWVFLHATMQDDHRQSLSYAGTRYAQADRHGMKSASYDALLQRRQGQWKIRIDRIGATDVPWTDWSAKYGAPTSIFGDGPGS